MGVLKRLSSWSAATIALAALPATAGAHIVADPGQAPAGAYQATAFRVGHGCGEAATTAVRVEIPAQVASARPQPKPGWTLAIEKDEGRVSAVTWRGQLPADQFDDFAVLLKLPDQPGELYFPTVQSCGAQESQWTEIPAPGEKADFPAPRLIVIPKPAKAETHQH